MIGFYDYTVIMTYASLCISMIGMYYAFAGHTHIALMCLAISGFLDSFDGKVARTKKNRTEDEKKFGIQIDSLCDLCCFGVFPVVICFHSGMHALWQLLILTFFVLAGLIRLAFFNVTEENRQQQEEGVRKYYQGLPITTSAIILPLVFFLSPFFRQYFQLVLSATMLITGFLYILDFKVPKITTKQFIFFTVVVAAAVLYILIFYRRRGYFDWNWRSLLDFLLWVDEVG